jgi:beta-galactosidase
MNRRNFLFTGSASLAALQLLHGTRAFSSTPPNTISAADHALDRMLLFGADYYPDQTPEHRWEEDAAHMAAFGVTNVRMAEFAWSLMEPSEGSFDFAWLDRAVGTLHKHGIGVILGTPSAAPPPWLSQKYPQILEVNDQGLTLSPGTRRFTCPTNKTYRALSVKIATEMAQHYAQRPGVIGWQIDNELTLGGSGRCYCRYCRAGFQDWLRAKYKTLDAINADWGTAFWSNIYTDFTQIPVPLPSGAPPNPGFALDYDRYQSYANVSFLAEQLAVLRRLCPKQFITTNNVSLVDTIDMRDLYRDLDFVASDNYPGFFAVQGPGGSISAQAVAPLVSYSLDFSRSIRGGEPFFIMEQQTGKSGQPNFSPQPEPGQLRLWSFQAVAHGAMGINYFRWDTETAGAEQYWHGILQHDRLPSPGYDEIKQTIREMKLLGHEALHARSEAGIALCVDYSSGWALSIQPGQPEVKYMTEVSTWYGVAAPAQAGIDIVDAAGDLSQYKVLLAPAMYVVGARQAAAIRAFVQGGGTFIAGFRLGVKDEHSRIVEVPLPGLLRDVMGVELFDYQPVYSEKQSVEFTGALAGPSAACHLWADILTPKGAEVLATYTGGAYSGKAAITSHAFGKGRAMYVGAGLDPKDLARVLMRLLAEAGVKPQAQASQNVELTVRRSGAKRWTYLLNHDAAPQTVTLTGTFKDAMGGAAVSGSVTLPAYGVRVLESA